MRLPVVSLHVESVGGSTLGVALGTGRAWTVPRSPKRDAQRGIRVDFQLPGPRETPTHDAERERGVSSAAFVVPNDYRDVGTLPTEPDSIGVWGHGRCNADPVRHP